MAEDPGSLLVFGYACKLFRDDEKAASIDQGHHLIPWMGDSSLRIDRYDGRGALHNLEDHVAKPGSGHRVDPTEGLSDVEKVEEELCEEERYRALKYDDSEDLLKAEEEKKREKMATTTFSQVGFSYDSPHEQQQQQQSVGEGQQEFGPTNTQVEEDFTPFTPTKEMNIPDDMELPPTNKLYSVIAKTAKFLAFQGAQMEILLKAKQSNNPAFQFLNLDSPLNAFYKHLVRMIKSKQFIPQLGTDKSEQQEARPYGALSLVPQYSNFPKDQVHIAPKIPTIKYKKDEDCSYSKLISLMKQKAAPVPPVPPPPSCPVVPPPAPPIQFPPPRASPPPPPASQTGFLSVQPSEVVPPPPPEAKEKDPPILIPPPDLQTIVDKMASYVSKNGRGFEEVVKSRRNPKFTFLNPSDKHHQYYLHKLNVYTTGNYDPQLNAEPLTFKVKKSVVKDESNLNSTNALPYEASDSGEENEEKESAAKEPAAPAKTNSGFPVLKGFLPTDSFHVKSEPQIYPDASDDAIEKIKEEDRVRLENNKKVRDRLAAATREKMIQVSREKALQLERKRKAAHFLAQLAEKRTMVSSVEPIEIADDDDEEDEEGEIKEISQEEMTFGVAEDREETISAVNIWPPPPPPQLVIPKLSTPQPPLSARSSRDASPEGESSESESSSRHSRSKSRKQKRRHSRSRSREKRKRRKRSRSRSRSRHKKRRKHKKSSRHKKSSKSKRDRDYSSRSDSSDNEEPRRKKEREKEVNEEDSTKESAPTSPEVSRSEVSEHRDNGTQAPAFSKITEDLRAKVRAMLATKKTNNT